MRDRGIKATKNVGKTDGRVKQGGEKGDERVYVSKWQFNGDPIVFTRKH